MRALQRCPRDRCVQGLQLRALKDNVQSRAIMQGRSRTGERRRQRRRRRRQPATITTATIVTSTTTTIIIKQTWLNMNLTRAQTDNSRTISYEYHKVWQQRQRAQQVQVRFWANRKTHETTERKCLAVVFLWTRKFTLKLYPLQVCGRTHLILAFGSLEDRSRNFFGKFTAHVVGHNLICVSMYH